jgi:hypothetical protein
VTSEAKGPTAPQAHAVCNAREAKHEAVVAVVVDLEVAVVSSRLCKLMKSWFRC